MLGRKKDSLSSQKVTVRQVGIQTHHENHAAPLDEKDRDNGHKKIEQPPEIEVEKPKKKKAGRPKKKGEKMVEHIKLYVTEDMKEHLENHFGSSTRMRQFLLEESGYSGKIE